MSLLVLHICTHNRVEKKQIQSGLHVDGILCKDCENFIGKWDEYAQNLLLKEIDIDSIFEKQEITKEIQIIENVNYKLLKLFFLSLLWRIHVARNNYFLTKTTKDGEIKKDNFSKK
jgi:hypothetical protein